MTHRRKIANRSDLMSVYRKYRRFRNEAQGLLCADTLRVIWAYSRFLDDDDFKFPADVQVSKQFLELDHTGRWITPWDLELIAKEVILNCDDFSLLGARTARHWNTLAEFINALKYFENEASAFNQQNIIIELNRIAHRQFTWQKNIPAVMFARYHKIFGTPAINNILIAETGLSIDELYRCAIAMVSCYLLEPSLDIPIPCDIPGLTNEIMKKFLTLTCKPIGDLRIILRNEQRYDETFFYAYNSLRAYPIVAMASEQITSLICPIPTLLIWRVTAGLYYELRRDQRFSNAFGASFQAYVGDIIRRASPSALQLIPEHRYGPKKTPKASADWVLAGNEAAIFFECKGKRVTWDAKIGLNDLAALEADLDQMADAVVQLYKTITDYCSGLYQAFRFNDALRIFPVVVTLEDWHIFFETARKLREAVLAKLPISGLPGTLVEEIPYSIWSLDDLGSAIQIIDNVGISSFIDGKLRDPEMSQWEWQAYVARAHKGKHSWRRLLRDDFDAVFQRIIPDGLLPT